MSVISRLSITLFLSLLVTAFLRAEPLDDLLLITEEYPPINFEQNGRIQGISVDLLVEMLELTGSELTRDDIQLWPWARGYLTVQRQPGTMLFSMSRTPEREDLFRWVGPIMSLHMSLIGRASDNLQIDSIKDLNASNLLVGVVNNDVAHQLLLEQGADPARLHTGVVGTSLAQMLATDRIDLWGFGEQVALWTLREQGESPRDYKEILVLSETETYYALHKETPDEVVDALQEALETLKENGTVDRIIDRYLQ